MIQVQFEYYVLHYDYNRKEVGFYNVFNNWLLNDSANVEIRKYIRNPKKYGGFEELCKRIDSLIKWQEWSRVEYEISVGRPFETNIDNLQKFDCYEQCKNNIPMICRELLWQYRHKPPLSTMENS